MFTDCTALICINYKDLNHFNSVLINSTLCLSLLSTHTSWSLGLLADGRLHPLAGGLAGRGLALATSRGLAASRGLTLWTSKQSISEQTAGCSKHIYRLIAYTYIL